MGVKMNKQTLKVKRHKEQNETKSLESMLTKPCPTLSALSIPVVVFILHVELKVHVPYFVHWKVLMTNAKSGNMLAWPLPCTLKMVCVHSGSGTVPAPEAELTSMSVA